MAPILTIFIGGNHEASNYLQELPYGGWVAPNIYYLGYAGVITVNGIRIAGISGIYKGHDFLRGHHEFPPYNDKTCRSVYHVRQLEVFRLMQLSGKVDIFMSHDWPRGIQEYGNKAQLLRFKPHFMEDIESGQLGSRPLEELLKAVQPTYWFAAHLHCKFAALVPHTRNHIKSRNADDASSSSSNESEDENEDNDSNQLQENVVAAPVPVTKFLALDKCLPRRRFLQVLDIPSNESSEGKLTLKYDAEWLSILRTTNHLISVKDNNYYLPGKKAGSIEERCNFTPTDEELEHIRAKFESLNVPENFCRTVLPFDPHEEHNYKQKYIEQANPMLNPQSNEFCSILGIDDPLCLAMLASGKDLPQTASLLDSSIDVKEDQAKLEQDMPTLVEPLATPPKRKLNMSLPAPIVAVEIDKSVIELPDEIEELATATIADSKVEETTPICISPNLKKLKRRNQSIYQAEDDD